MINSYADQRDKTLAKVWESNSLEPLDKFIKDNEHLYVKGFYESWNKASEKTKWLAACKMTMQITSSLMDGYRAKAIEKYNELSRKVGD